MKTSAIYVNFAIEIHYLDVIFVKLKVLSFFLLQECVLVVLIVVAVVVVVIGAVAMTSATVVVVIQGFISILFSTTGSDW